MWVEVDIGIKHDVKVSAWVMGRKWCQFTEIRKPVEEKRVDGRKWVQLLACGVLGNIRVRCAEQSGLEGSGSQACQVSAPRDDRLSSIIIISQVSCVQIYHCMTRISSILYLLFLQEFPRVLMRCIWVSRDFTHFTQDWNFPSPLSHLCLAEIGIHDSFVTPWAL